MSQAVLGQAQASGEPVVSQPVPGQARERGRGVMTSESQARRGPVRCLIPHLVLSLAYTCSIAKERG